MEPASATLRTDACRMAPPANGRIDAYITTTSRYLRRTPVRLAQALERMETSPETVVDVDDQTHHAAVR